VHSLGPALKLPRQGGVKLRLTIDFPRQKLLEVDKMRKNERFASGQPRHWDLVSEVQRDRPSTGGRTRSAYRLRVGS